MTPQNGTQGLGESIPPQLIVLILVFGLLVIGVFTAAMTIFIRAGGKDAKTRRARGEEDAKDPLDPRFDTDAGRRDQNLPDKGGIIEE